MKLKNRAKKIVWLTSKLGICFTTATQPLRKAYHLLRNHIPIKVQYNYHYRIEKKSYIQDRQNRPEKFNSIPQLLLYMFWTFFKIFSFNKSSVTVFWPCALNSKLGAVARVVYGKKRGRRVRLGAFSLYLLRCALRTSTLVHTHTHSQRTVYTKCAAFNKWRRRHTQRGSQLRFGCVRQIIIIICERAYVFAAADRAFSKKKTLTNIFCIKFTLSYSFLYMTAHIFSFISALSLSLYVCYIEKGRDV